MGSQSRIQATPSEDRGPASWTVFRLHTGMAAICEAARYICCPGCHHGFGRRSGRNKRVRTGSAYFNLSGTELSMLDWLGGRSKRTRSGRPLASLAVFTGIDVGGGVCPVSAKAA